MALPADLQGLVVDASSTLDVAVSHIRQFQQVVRVAPEILKIATANGNRISAVYLPNPSARFTLLVSHGNAEDLGDDRFWLEDLRRAKGLQFSGRLAVLGLFGMINWIYTWHNPRVVANAHALAQEMGDLFLRGVLNPGAPDEPGFVSVGRKSGRSRRKNTSA